MKLREKVTHPAVVVVVVVVGGGVVVVVTLCALMVTENQDKKVSYHCDKMRQCQMQFDGRACQVRGDKIDPRIKMVPAFQEGPPRSSRLATPTRQAEGGESK